MSRISALQKTTDNSDFLNKIVFLVILTFPSEMLLFLIILTIFPTQKCLLFSHNSDY